jgi:hypothetical protein
MLHFTPSTITEPKIFIFPRHTICHSLHETSGKLNTLGGGRACFIVCKLKTIHPRGFLKESKEKKGYKKYLAQSGTY